MHTRSLVSTIALTFLLSVSCSKRNSRTSATPVDQEKTQTVQKTPEVQIQAKEEEQKPEQLIITVNADGEEVISATKYRSFVLLNRRDCVELRTGSDRSANAGLDWVEPYNTKLYASDYQEESQKNLVYREMKKLESKISLRWGLDLTNDTLLNPSMLPAEKLESFGDIKFDEESENLSYYSLFADSRSFYVGRFLFSTDNQKIYLKEEGLDPNGERTTNIAIRFSMIYIDIDFGLKCAQGECAERQSLKCHYRESLDLKELDQGVCVWIDAQSFHTTREGKKPYCW